MKNKLSTSDKSAAFSNRHKLRLTDPQYYQRWIIKNATAQNLRNGNRPAITLPKIAFLERPEVHPDL